MSGLADPAPGTLRSRVLRGLAWKAASLVFLQLSRSIVAIVLVRLLTPEEWGVAAMVVVLSGLSVLFTDSALGTALIQKRVLTEADRSTVFWTSVGVGVVLMTVGIAGSGLVADFYGEPEVGPLLTVLSVSFLISSIGLTQTALLVRAMDFRSLELRQMGATLAGAVVGISVAVGGYGAWAVVLQQVTAACVATILIWSFSSWRPTLLFSLDSLRSIGGFVGNLFSQNLLYQVGRAADKVLIGRYLGAASLGAYTVASSVILAPFNQIAAPLQQVLFPAFSTIQDDRVRLADVWIRVARLVGALSMPALIGLIIVTPDFVDAVLGDRWSDATPVIRILAGVGLIQSLQTLNGEVLLALGRAGTLLRYTILWFVATLGAIAVALGLGWEIVGVAAAYAVASVLVEPLNAYLTARALGMSVFRFVRAFSGVAQATALMAVVLIGLRSLGGVEGLPALARLLLCIAVGVIVYVPACLWAAPEVRAEVATLVKRRRRSSG